MNEIQTENLDSNRYFRKATRILYIFTICIVTILGVIKKETFYNMFKLNLLSIILASILLFYAKENKIKIIENRKNLFMVIGSFLFSLICVLFTIEYPIYHLWLIGPMLIAAMIDVHFGLSVHLLFAFLLSIISSYSIDRLVYNFIIGALACILAQYTIEIKKIGYALIIFLSSNISLILIMNNFMRHNTLDMNILHSVITCIVLFCIVASICFLYNKWTTQQDKSKEESSPEKQVGENQLQPELRKELNRYISEDFILLRELKAFSNKLYQRSIQVGDISYQAAQRIDIQAKLARVGGYYCKIGRLVSDDYVDEGVQILQNFEFPQLVIDIIRQHNLKSGNPLTKEAAVVMLTDNIIASIDTMKSMKDRKPVSYSKLIDGIFTLRLTKGNLDESGLGITELKKLKEFYQDIFKEDSV